MKNKLLFTVPMIGFLVLLIGVSSVSADNDKCFDSYGREIECPVINKSFSVEKVVRLSGSNDWSEMVNTKPDQEVEFEIRVKNTGELKVSNLEVIDVLPNNLDFTSGQATWIINDFEPQTERVLPLLKAKTNHRDIADNQEKCVPNVVNLVYQSVKEASDTAIVCIKKEAGEVLGEVKALPQTGFEENFKTLGLAIMTLLTGIIVLNSVIISESSIKLKK